MRINGKLNDLLTLLMESSWHREAHTNAPKKMDISSVKSFLDEHYKEKLSLEAVASHFFIDKGDLSDNKSQESDDNYTSVLPIKTRLKI